MPEEPARQHSADVGVNWPFLELEAVAMWSYSEGLPLRDFFAVEILKGLMLRQGQPGYSDRGAIDEAYQLSDYMVERRESATAETAEAGQHPPTPQGVNAQSSASTVA